MATKTVTKRQLELEYELLKLQVKEAKERNAVYKPTREYTGRFSIFIGGSGCVDCDTEYFNGKQWIPINQYDGKKVLQYNEDGTAELINPKKYIKEPCEELTHFNTFYGIDQCLSDEHIVVYQTSKGHLAKKRFSEVKRVHNETSKGFYGRFYTTFDYSGKGINLNEYELRLMVATIADGSFQIDNNRCRFNLKKDRKKERLKWLFDKCKIEYVETKSTNEGFVFFYANVPMHLKNFPTEWYNCSKRQLEIIAEECLLWDGSTCNGSKTYSSTIKKDADFIQFVFSSIGERATISINDRTGQEYLTAGKMYIRKSVEYTVCVSKNKTVSVQNRHKKAEMKPYKTKDGFKYCFTVPSGMLVLRRNNKIFITGNSGKSYEVADLVIDRIVHETRDKVGQAHRILCIRNERKQVSESQFPLLRSRALTRYPDLDWEVNRAQGNERISYNGNEIIFAGLDKQHCSV